MSIEQRKIDAHGHFFKSYIGPESPIENYWLHAEKIGVVYCVSSPGPSPEYLMENGIYRPAIWKLEEGRIRFVEQTVDPATQDVQIEQPSKINPYKDANERLLNESFTRNAKTKEKIFVMPIHHPFLDTDDEIVGLIRRRDVVGIKFHGIATFSGPDDVRDTVINELRQTQKPLIVHTDYFAGKTSNPFLQACQMNDPVEWITWANERDVKILITHAARLSEEALQLAKGHKNIVIGCSPDLLQTQELDHLVQPTHDYYADLFRMMPASQIVFDIDYGWNVRERNKWDTNDWDMTKRLETAAQKSDMKSADLDAIYFDNASKFFQIP